MKHLHKLFTVVIIAVLFMSVFTTVLTPATVTTPTTDTPTLSDSSNGKIIIPVCLTPDMCIIHSEVAWNS